MPLYISNVSVEPGSWTPVLVGASTAGSHTYATQTGEYVPIGNGLILASFSVALSAFDVTAAGALRITGLPYAVKSGTLAYGACLSSAVTFQTGRTALVALATAGTSYIGLLEYGSGVGLALTAATQLGDTSSFRGSVIYRKA